MLRKIFSLKSTRGEGLGKNEAPAILSGRAWESTLPALSSLLQWSWWSEESEIFQDRWTSSDFFLFSSFTNAFNLLRGIHLMSSPGRAALSTFLKNKFLEISFPLWDSPKTTQIPSSSFGYIRVHYMFRKITKILPSSHRDQRCERFFPRVHFDYLYSGYNFVH